MHGIYNHIPETNHVSMVYSVAAVLELQFMIHLVLFPCLIFCTLTLVVPQHVRNAQYDGFL
jgi:hypothetical protein